MTDATDGARAPLLKDRPLEFGGKSFRLRGAMIAWLALKERWAIEDDAALIKRLGRQNITDIPARVWACMQSHHPELTYAAVVRMLDDADPEDVKLASRTAEEALAAGWGTPAAKKDEPKAAS